MDNMFFYLSKTEDKVAAMRARTLKNIIVIFWYCCITFLSILFVVLGIILIRFQLSMDVPFNFYPVSSCYLIPLFALFGIFAKIIKRMLLATIFLAITTILIPLHLCVPFECSLGMLIEILYAISIVVVFFVTLKEWKNRSKKGGKK